MIFPKRLYKKLDQRKKSNSLRTLTLQNNLVDFSSNDYLGFGRSGELHKNAMEIIENHPFKNGTTGSRLLSGNHELHQEVEQQLATFFNSESALLFNSGYDANIGLFSSVLQRGDTIFYDELIHASIRDGIQLSNATAFKFKHNDLIDLEKKLSVRAQSRTNEFEIYIVTESVFSMDGDSPDLLALTKLCQKHNIHLIVDEAHATGVLGKHGCGMVKELGLEKEVFARIHTFGKALGCHGAVVLVSKELQSYLINFARSFIYTTAIPLHTVATIKVAFKQLVDRSDSDSYRNEESPFFKLQENIQYFNQQRTTNRQQLNFIKSHSAIHCCIIPGNEKVKQIAIKLREKGFDIKPILSPTVINGQERLRICLHSYNSKAEIDNLLNLLGTFVNESSLRTE